MFGKFHITSDIGEVHKRFFKAFTLLVIIETILRFMICLSFPSKLYAFSLAGIFIVYVSIYVLYIKKALKDTYAIGTTLSFYFLTHFVYVIGTYSFQPKMLLWFLVIPIVARIYYSNKVSLIITIATAISVVLIIKASSLTDILEHYKEIVLDYYGNPASELIINSFVLIIFIYIAVAVYYLIQVLIIQYSSLRGKSQTKQENKELISLREEKISDLNMDSSERDDVADNYSIRDVRLQGIYESVIAYMETSECYLNSEYTLAQLAIDLKINKITLSNSLNGVGGVSFKDLLNQYRIKKAKHLFEKDTFQSSNIKQTYMNVGFKYHTTFNRVFKKLEGMTPTEYIIKIKNSK